MFSNIRRELKEINTRLNQLQVQRVRRSSILTHKRIHENTNTRILLVRPTAIHQRTSFSNDTDTFRSYSVSCKRNHPSSSVLNDDEQGLLSYIENETKFTEKQIDTLLSNIDDEDSKQQISKSVIEKEIFDAASLLGDSEPETGPTGKYIYHLEDDLSLGKRIYSRKPIDSSPNNNPDEIQKVFEINLQMEYLGPMSLSTDERYAVRMVIYIPPSEMLTTTMMMMKPMKPQIIITDIETGREYKMSNASHHNFHNVEFGPKYKLGSKEYHSLFFTISDETGRPYAVYTCAFDGESFSTMRVMYKDKNPANLVDVQRTKGCQYVAISSSSKVDNEIYIVGGEDFNEKDILRDSNRKVPWKKPKLVKKRQRGIQYYVDCGDRGDVIILAHRATPAADDDCSTKSYLDNEMSVFEAQIDNLPLSSDDFGKPIHLHKKDSNHFIEDIALFKDHVVLFERSCADSTQQIRIVDRSSRTSEKSSTSTILSLESLEGVVEHKQISPCGNIQYNSNSFKFDVESPLTPAINYVYDFKSGMLTSSPFSVDIINDNIQSKRVHVESEDGTQVPLTMYYDQTVPIRGVILIGYGSYGQSQNLSYDPALVPLVKRGFLISYCHGRGGGDLGKQWYEAGRLYNKQNAINDYMSCAKALSNGTIPIPNYHYQKGSTNKEEHNNNHQQQQQQQQQHPTSSLFLVSKSFSAGGVVAAASLNKVLEEEEEEEEESNNSIFQAVSLINPFLDVIGTMSKSQNNNPSSSSKSEQHGYLIEHEYDEFGDPVHDERARSLIRSYCPVLNIKHNEQEERGERSVDYDYPPMFIVSTLDDENVPFHHGIVYAKKVREAMKSCSGDDSSIQDVNVLLHIEKVGGHHLHGRRLDVCTLENCFLLGHLYGSKK